MLRVGLLAKSTTGLRFDPYRCMINYKKILVQAFHTKERLQEKGILCRSRTKELEGANQKGQSVKRIKMHRPGIEPGSTAWKAIILPLNHRCLATRYPRSLLKSQKFLLFLSIYYIYQTSPIKLCVFSKYVPAVSPPL